MTLVRRIPEGGYFPTVLGVQCYAVAYRDWDTEQSVCYPIPLHLVVRMYRDFVFRAREWWRPSYREQIEHMAHQRGFDRGRAWGEKKHWDTGFESGYRAGLTDGAEKFKKNLLAQFDATYDRNPDEDLG